MSEENQGLPTAKAPVRKGGRPKARVEDDEDTTPLGQEQVTPPSIPAKAPVRSIPAANAPSYDRATKKKIRELIAQGTQLTGNESPELIETYYATMEEEDKELEKPAEELEGVPNTLPQRHTPLQVHGKPVNYPIFFVAPVKGGFCMYNEFGRRVSQVCSEASDIQKLNRDCSRSNILRQASRKPDEILKGI